jgi:hypothetical protein
MGISHEQQSRGELLKNRAYPYDIVRQFSGHIINACCLICAAAIGGGPLAAQAQPVSAAPSTQLVSEAGRVPLSTTNGDGNRLVMPDRATSSTHLANPGARLWKLSLVALTTANALDIRSSWKKRELNPVLAQSSSTFGWQAALLKMGISGAVMGMEYLATRGHGHPGLYRILSIANFGSAAAVGAVATHNYTLPAAQR